MTDTNRVGTTAEGTGVSGVREIDESVMKVVEGELGEFQDGVPGISVVTPSEHRAKRVTWGAPLESVKQEAYERGKEEARAEAARLLALESEEQARRESEAELIPRPVAGSLAWGQLQEEIIASLIQDNDEWGGLAMTELALRMRSSLDEFEYIRDASDQGQWMANRMEQLLQREKVLRRGLNWDRVEAGALDKIQTMLARNQIRTLPEILQVARVANMATRRGQGPGGEDMSTNPNAPYVQVNIGAGAAEGGLPGPGSIGVLKLTLSQRTVQQLSHSKTIDGDVVKLTESAEMLDGSDIPELQRMVDDGA